MIADKPINPQIMLVHVIIILFCIKNGIMSRC